MSDSVRPQRRKPTRLPRPWDSPGKNTGVGCHFLLQCMKVKSESEFAQSCLTLIDPMDCSLPGSSMVNPWDFPGKSTGVGCHCLLREEGLGWNFSNSVPNLCSFQQSSLLEQRERGLERARRTASRLTVSSKYPPSRSNFVKWGNCRKHFFNFLVKISFINQISSLEFLALSKDNFIHLVS